MAKRDYLGTGLTFPLQTNVQGGLRLSSDHQDVREAIWIILRTELGERVYRPNFGCRLSELTFAPLNTRTLFLIKLYVQEALEIWEPRIYLDEVITEPDPVLGRVDIRIEYRLKESYQPGSLVYPFYLMAKEG
ncbi:GPW/gp25 family protein [Gloeothece citriformis PCC 7424]|uniref:GPW/gp25 family protein n=1 Tax=Gloeothece citriformis (strain PCC 7424) TaxID=65393 RepID=B7KJY7_GLOC7|nr:GPW/gp25 family protein [Gloeothece citriformis]ACK69586.1 GPW/gp25 family protein [Gloeothece citriformis PCC 7424]